MGDLAFKRMSRCNWKNLKEIYCAGTETKEGQVDNGIREKGYAEFSKLQGTKLERILLRIDVLMKR